MILGDFHVHSTFSDGKLTIPELIDFYGHQGLGAIAITDHICEDKSLIGRSAHFFNRTLTPFNFEHYMDTLRAEIERAWDQYRMIVIPGFEVTKNSLNNHRSAHIVALGVHEYIDPHLDILQTIRKIKSLGGLAIAAHPVDTGKWEKQTYHLWDQKEALASELDAWEVASGPVMFDEVLRSGLPMVASSDLHHPRQMSSWKTVLNCEKHPEAIFRAIRKQDLSFRFHHAVTSARPFSFNVRLKEVL